MKLEYIAPLVLIAGVTARYLWVKYKYAKLKKEVWLKGFNEKGDIDSYSVTQLIREANLRRRNNRDKNK